MSAVFLTTPALADRMAAAGRELAWRSAIDVATMDGLIRKVARHARDSLIVAAIFAAGNDDEGDP